MENVRLSPVRFERIKDDAIKHLNDDMAEDVPVIEKRIRRRSSVFAEVRKSLIENRKVNDSDGPHNEQSPKETHVSRYIEELKKEKKEWSDATKKRKQEYEDTYKKYNNHCKERQMMPEKECLPCLDESDMMYLRSLPKFEFIGIKYRRLRESQKILEDYRRTNINNAMDLLNLIRQDIESKKHNIRIYSKHQPL